MRNRLDLEVRVGEAAQVPEWPELIILVDGRDVFGEAWDGIGRDPDTLIGLDSPLAASQAPRHVAVQRCGCGEEGCASLVARIRREGDEVVWDDFRQGSEDEPSEEAVDLGEFRFDRQQYERELERAHRERPWESPDRRTARLLREQFRRSPTPVAASGWTFGAAWGGLSRFFDPAPGTPATEPSGGVTVILRSGGRQLALDFADDGATPETRASRIVDALVHGDPSMWRVTFKGGTPSEWPDAERDELGSPRPAPFRG